MGSSPAGEVHWKGGLSRVAESLSPQWQSRRCLNSTRRRRGCLLETKRKLSVDREVQRLATAAQGRGRASGAVMAAEARRGGPARLISFHTISPSPLLCNGCALSFAAPEGRTPRAAARRADESADEALGNSSLLRKVGFSADPHSAEKVADRLRLGLQGNACGLCSPQIRSLRQGRAPGLFGVLSGSGFVGNAQRNQNRLPPLPGLRP